MSKDNIPGKIFTGAYRKIEKTIPYQMEWKDDEGYYSGIHRHVRLESAEMVKTEDENGRRIIFIGTRFGTIAVFDRYPDQSEGGVYVTSAPMNPVLRTMMSNSVVGAGEMAVLLGSWYDITRNIGYTIENMALEFELTP